MTWLYERVCMMWLRFLFFRFYIRNRRILTTFTHVCIENDLLEPTVWDIPAIVEKSEGKLTHEEARTAFDFKTLFTDSNTVFMFLWLTRMEKFSTWRAFREIMLPTVVTAADTCKDICRLYGFDEKDIQPKKDMEDVISEPDNGCCQVQHNKKRK